MTTPIERMIDATVRCLCCEATRADCRCAEGVRCEVCAKCAFHCRDTEACQTFWLNLRHWLEQEG